PRRAGSLRRSRAIQMRRLVGAARRLTSRLCDARRGPARRLSARTGHNLSMTMQPRARFVVDAQSKPAFTRFSRLHEDRVRNRFVVLAPERAYEIDAISLAVLQLID